MLPLESKGGGEGGRARLVVGQRQSLVDGDRGLENQTADSTGGV